jgi:hypothetical protein
MLPSPKLLPGTWVSAHLWPTVDPELPLGSVVRQPAPRNRMWTKREDDCWYLNGSDDTFLTTFDSPVTIVQVGTSRYSL